MGFIIGILTVVLVLNCLLLILLVLIQLPKKEAGAGLAFGGAATDALFGAGSGNALTKITKYSTVIFFVLALAVGIMQSRMHRSAASELEGRLQAGGTAPAPVGVPAPSAAPTAPSTPTTPPPAVPLVTNLPTPPPQPEGTPAPPK